MRILSQNSSFKKTLVCLVLFIILYNGILFTVSPEFSFTTFLRSFVSHGSFAGLDACPKMSIQPVDFATLDQKDVACRPHIQSAKACEYTATAYSPYPSLLDCPELPYVLCTIREKKPSLLKVRCDISLCDPGKPIFVELMSPKDGKMTKYDLPIGVNDSTVANFVLKHVEASRAADLNFLFLNCTGLYTRVKISQLLTFLPKLPPLANQTQRNKVNVNVFLIDSLSRAHFYRSLPNTIKYLRNVNADANFSAHVFEYELFQAVHGHTHQSEHAFFSGTLYPKEWTSKQRSAKPVNLEILYGEFKKEGYQTMFLDDLCWQAIYGMVSKVKAGSWRSLLSKMKSTNVDTRGMNEAACKVLMTSGKHLLPFFDNKEHQLCFNGKHQHEYLIDYLVRYIDEIKTKPQSKPLFSYTTTHVSHDEIGLRVQSFDRHLIEFIETLSTRHNTISFIFADHGNTYTSYQVKFLEGRQEMYHPMMLIVVPKQLARKFGDNIMRNLKINQHRLFNLFDFRKSLVALAKFDGISNLEQVGLFGHISKHRMCSDLSSTEDVICICRARKISKLNATEEFIMSEFAVGQLNNKIQDALLKTRGSNVSNDSSPLFGSCQRLRIQKVGNAIQESKSGGLLVTSLDITVQSDTIVKQEELFSVRVESTVEMTQSFFKMKLLYFDRISKYGLYEECADQDVPIILCVCNKKSTASKTSTIQEILGVNSKINPHPSNSCIIEVRREISDNKTPKVGVYEIANVCRWYTVDITITSTEDIKTSSDLPIYLRLPPRTVYFVSSLRAQSLEDELDLKIEINNRTKM